MMKTGCTGTERPKNGTGGLRRVVLALAVLLLTCVLMAGAVSAENPVYVGSWEDLEKNLTAGISVILDDDIEATETFTLTGGTVTLDLKGHQITGPTDTKNYPYTFTVKGSDANLTIKNSGNTGGTITGYRGVNVSQGELTVQSGVTIDCTYAGIFVYGSTSQTAKDYSVATIEKGATIKGQYGVVLFGKQDAYGAVLDVSGSLIGKTETPQPESSDGAFGIFVSGNLKEMEGNVPEIIIREDASLTGGSIGDKNGQAIAGNGYANITIYGGTFTGDEALGVKGGKWTIHGGTFTATGAFSDPPAANNNGAEATGAAVSVTTNDGYAMNVELTITGGTFHSKNQSAFYEGESSQHKGTALKGVKISGDSSFTTDNATLSAVTIHNSGNTTITGISIIDTAGNNLLYRGVNLTGVAKWTGDARNGYTLVLDGQNAKYKLMDAFNTTGSGIQITADGVTLDGDNKQITTAGDLGGYILKVDVDGTDKAEGVTLQNLNITGNGQGSTGNYGGITIDAGKNGNAQKTSVPVTLKDSIIDMSDVSATGTMNPAVYFVNASNSRISGNTIIAGSTDSSSTRCVVLDGGEGSTVTGNKLHLGPTSSEEGSMGVQIKGSSTRNTVSGNTFIAPNDANTDCRAVEITAVKDKDISSSITGNTINFLGQQKSSAVRVVL